MESFVKADIFFLITSFAVIVGGICIAIISVYLIRILKDVKAITKEAKKEVEKIVSDVDELRIDLKEEGDKLIDKAMIIGKFINNKIHPRKRIHKRHDNKETTSE